MVSENVCTTCLARSLTADALTIAEVVLHYTYVSAANTTVLDIMTCHG